MALVFTGVAPLKLVANALLCFTPAFLIYSCFTLLYIYMHMLYSYSYSYNVYIYIYIYIYIYVLLLLYFRCTCRYVCNCCNPALLQYIHLFSCLTRTLFVLFLLCVCVCRLTGLVECVEESEGLRRNGAWEHGVLQQKAAGEMKHRQTNRLMCVY